MICFSGQAAVGSDIPEDVIQSFPLEKIREHGPLLAPGMQCRVCLRGYQLGQFVRKLPRCKHKVYTCSVKSRYLKVDETIFYKFKLPKVQINLHFG